VIIEAPADTGGEYNGADGGGDSTSYSNGAASNLGLFNGNMAAAARVSSSPSVNIN
jgi:hypothetical protein